MLKSCCFLFCLIVACFFSYGVVFGQSLNNPSSSFCGSAHGVATTTAPSGSALCSVGVPFGIVNGPQGNPASYTWLCQNSVGKKVQCQASYQPPILAETCVPYQPSVHTNTAVSLGSAKALGLSAVGTTIPSHPDVSVSTQDYQVLSGDLGNGNYLKVTFTNLFRPILIGPYVPQFIQHTNPTNNKFYGCNPANRNAGNPGAWNTKFKVSCEVCTKEPVTQGTWTCEIPSSPKSNGRWQSKGGYSTECTAYVQIAAGGAWEQKPKFAMEEEEGFCGAHPYNYQEYLDNYKVGYYSNIAIGYFMNKRKDPTLSTQTSSNMQLLQCATSTCDYMCEINQTQHPDKCEFVSTSLGASSRAVCKDGQGNILPDSACTAPKPDCLPKTYAWETGDWGVCTGGSQTRTVVCKDNTGVVVADSFCPSLKPNTSQTCSNTGATYRCDAHQNRADWRKISNVCATGTPMYTQGVQEYLVGDQVCSMQQPANCECSYDPATTHANNIQEPKC